MEPRSWLEKAHTELESLAPIARADEADAWRACVLIARLNGNPFGLAVPDDPLERARTLVEVAGPPDPQSLLDDLANFLADDEDPEGRLLDVLLDIDDAVGVTHLLGQTDTANELALRAAALVSLYPERVFALGAFADMRLGTLSADAPIAVMWRAVEQAPATLLVEALPPMAAPPLSALARRPGPRVTSVPVRLLRAAASSAETKPIRLDIEGSEFDAWLEQDAGRMRLEIRGERVAPSRASLIACLTTGEELAVEQLVLEEAGRATACADLGPWAGSENALHRLIARTGRTADEIDVQLRIEDD